MLRRLKHSKNEAVAPKEEEEEEEEEEEGRFKCVVEMRQSFQFLILYSVSVR
jgi:hypothetical protein